MNLEALYYKPALLALLCGFLSFGCATTKPPPEPSRTRVQAEHAYEAGQEAYKRHSWAASAKSFEQAADTFAAVDDFGAEATARHNCGLALRKAGQLDAAIESYQQAIAINQRLKRTAQEAQNLAGLAGCYRAQKKLDLAVETAEQALKLTAGSKLVTAKIQNDLALSLLQRGDPNDKDRILQLLTSALQTNEAAGDRRTRAANYLNLGRAQLQFQQLDASEANVSKALDLFRALDDPAGLAASHELLAKLYSKRGDEEKARFHREQALQKYEFLKDEAGIQRMEKMKMDDGK